MQLFPKSQIFLLGLNFLISFILLRHFLRFPGSDKSRSHTYIGDDFPVELPLDEKMELVALTLHETIHYDLNVSNPMVEQEWDTLMLYPRGFGRLHLGEERRVFNIVFWHQMHCLRSMERAIQDGGAHEESSAHHVQHCLNYLRQTFLCEADHTLEEGDFIDRDFEVQRIADTRMCRDWDTVERVMNERMLEFFDWNHKQHPEIYSKQNM